MSLKSRKKCFGSLIMLVLLVLLGGVFSPANAEDPPVYVSQFGTVGGGNGEFNIPMFIAVDSSGNVYVTDWDNNRIQKFNSSGTYLSQFGSSGSGNGEFMGPFAIAIDGSGNILVSETINHRIQKFSSSGTYISQFGTQGSGNGQFDSPSGIAFDSSGNIYVTDGQGDPRSADSKNNRIQKFNSSGTYISQFGTQGSGNGQFDKPFNIVIDSSGNIFVVDSKNNRIQKFSSSGVYISQFGSYGTGAGQFNDPTGIAFDSSGNIFVSDTSNHRIQKFSSSGIYLSQFGSEGTGNGQFKYPYGVAIGSSGNIYVADGFNNRVQTFAKATRIINISPGNLPFGDVRVGTTKPLTLTIRNTGNSPLTVSPIDYPAGFSGNWSSGAIPAGGSQNVTVTFSPTAACQTYSGTVTVSSDKTEGMNTATISGNGIADPCQCKDDNGSTQQGINSVIAKPGDYQLFTQTQLDAARQTGIQFCKDNPASCGLLTQAQSDQAVKVEQLKWDANGDGKIGLEDIIRMLQVIAGLRP